MPTICVTEVELQFKGQLLLEDESGPGLRVNLDVAEHHLAVESNTGGLGAWPLEVVEVRRLHGDVFAMIVAGETLRFVADDTIAFAYSGVPAIERVSRPRTRSALRSMFDRIWNGPEKTAITPATPSPAPSLSAPEPVAELEEMEPGRWDEISEVADQILDETVDLRIEQGHQDEEGGEETQPGVRPELAEDPYEDLVHFWSDSQQRIQPSADDDLAYSPRCRAIRSDGRRCESPILTSSGYCYPHDPKRAVEDGYQAAQEARAQLKHESTARLNRIYRRLDKAMRQVERGELEPEMAMAMAQLARTMCAILDIDEQDPTTGSG